jgi:putative endonuclease
VPGTDTGTSWNIYLLRCADGTLYTGIATDVQRRLAEHHSGERGAKYLRGRGPLRVELCREVGDRSLASRVEHRIKRLSRSGKEALINEPRQLDAMLAELQAISTA